MSANLYGFEFTLRVSPHVEAGMAYVVDVGGGAPTLFVRHFSEYATMCAGAHWHVEPSRCPTWTDATECRCMLGAEG